MRTVLAGKYAGEVKNYMFDFSSLAMAGVNFLGVTAVLTLYSGLVGLLPVLGTPNIVSNIATLSVSGGIVGNIYVIVVTATDGATQTAVNLNAFLPILPGQP